MSSLIIKGKLALELPKINQALEDACKQLPASTQAVAKHIFGAGGKRLRPLLTIITAKLFGHEDNSVYTLAITLEMLHAATLLHDDIIDNASMRRGQPAAHTIFPITTTILTGDALLAQGNAIVADFNNPKLSKCFSIATSETCAGEISEIEAQYNPTISEDVYINIIRGKTAKLISCACEMGAILANATADQIRACREFGENIGIAFQLVDDAIDFTSEKITGKPSGGDLREGKLTLPLRYYRASLHSAEIAKFDQAFQNKTFSAEDVQNIITQIQQSNFITKTRAVANSYLDKAMSKLMQLPDNSERQILIAMAEYVSERKK